jgi:hypothetical protein
MCLQFQYIQDYSNKFHTFRNQNEYKQHESIKKHKKHNENYCWVKQNMNNINNLTTNQSTSE